MIHETQIILCKHKKYESNPPHETKIPWVRYRRGRTIDDTYTRKHLLELDHLGGGLRGLFLLVQTLPTVLGLPLESNLRGKEKYFRLVRNRMDMYISISYLCERTIKHNVRNVLNRLGLVAFIQPECTSSFQ